MLFPTVEFALFFILAFPVYWGMPQNARPAFLLAVSAFFSWFAGEQTLCFYVFCCAVLAAKTYAAEHPKKNAALTAIALSPLIWIKTGAFFAQTLGVYDLLEPAIYSGKMPAGISFLTFGLLNWIWHPADKRFVLNAASMGAFPALFSGPVTRPSLANEIANPSDSRFGEAFWCFSCGLFLKLAVADTAQAYADKAFSDPAGQSAFAILAGAHAYSAQIYADFAGYSLMAIAVGMAFGFKLQENFNAPYLSASVTDFWRRWHISLSAFWKEKIYIPLGGNKTSKPAICANLMIVMLLCGLWHGAAWNFIFWGAFHGALLAAEKMAGRSKAILPVFPKLATFEIITLGWIFFRAPDLESAFAFIHSAASAEVFFSPADWPALLAVGTCLSAVLAEQKWGCALRLKAQALWEAHPLAFAFLLAQSFCLAVLLSKPGLPNFIYFSF